MWTFVIAFVSGFVVTATVGYTTHESIVTKLQDAIAKKGGCGAYDPLGTFYIMSCKDSAYADIIKAQAMQQDYDTETETIKASMNMKGKKR